MENQDNRTKSGSLIKHGLIVFCGAMAGSFLFLFLTAFFLGDPIKDMILSAHGILVEAAGSKISADETAMLNKMLAEGQILPANSILTTTITYYQSVITTLVALLGILSVVAYFYIKSVSARDAVDMAENAARKYFESTDFRIRADEVLQTNWQELTQYDWGDTKQIVSDYEKATAKIEAIDSRMMSIEENLAEKGSIMLEEGDK